MYLCDYFKSSCSAYKQMNDKTQSDVTKKENVNTPKSGADNNISVSVVIPTYNNGSDIHHCLDALMAQDYPPEKFEIVVVDDGSEDNTSRVVSEYEGRIPLVRYFYQTNHGPATARNAGASRAAGEIILFTDDDCVPERNWIREMTRPFETNSEIVAVKGAYRTNQESAIAKFAQIEFESRYRKMKNSEYVDFVDTYSAAFKRDVFMKLKGFDTSFPVANNEDVEFSYRMADAGYKMVFNPDAIVYHTHPDTLFKYMRNKFSRAYWRMAVYKTFPEKMRSDSYTPQTLKLQILFTGLIIASLAASILERRSLYIAGICTLLFLLTTIPFVFGILNFRFLNNAIAFIKRFLKRGFIRALLKDFREFFRTTILFKFFREILRLLRRILIYSVSLLRRFASSTLARKIFELFKYARTAISSIALLILKSIFWLASSPAKLINLLYVSIKSVHKFISELTVTRKILSVLNRIAGTKLFMIPLSVILLMLRGIVMGFGIIWGIRSHGTKKGRFSQVVLIVLGDILGITLACFAAYYTRTLVLSRIFSSFVRPLSFYLTIFPAILMFLLTTFFLSGLYRPYKGLSQINEFALLMKALLTGMLVSITALYLIGSHHSKSLVILIFVFALMLVSTFRQIIRNFYRKFSTGTSTADKTRVLMVGTQEIARIMCRKLQTTSSVDTTVVGFISKEPELVGTEIDGHEVLGSFDDLSSIIASYGIQEVFVALPMMPHEEVMHLVDAHSGKEGVSFHVVSNLFDLISAEIEMAEHNNIPVAYLQNENMALIHVMAKRIFDIAVSLSVIILTLPIWFLIMLAIKLETNGPAFFRQERVGKNGKIFEIIKFRTMYSDTSKFEYSPSNPNDKRITNVGKFLRKTSLDEFPQFLNILKGDMSMVGPRPEMPFIVEKYKSWERQRLKVKPGLTGLWQIMGRKDLPLHESLEYDFYYIKNQSLLLDMSILIKTIPTILLGKGAY